MPLRVLHTLHDYLPRHQAGSELYVAALAGAQRDAGHHPAVFAATFVPEAPHGSLRWRAHAGIPVVEVVNNWEGERFVDTYDAGGLRVAFEQMLDALRPDVVHVHNLLNLPLGLPSIARARGAAVVATLHDYTLVCPSGGQRVHRAEAHLCQTIEPDRCARCFGESPFHTQWRFGRLSSRVPGGLAGRVAAIATRAPLLRGAARAALAGSPGPTVTSDDIARRLETARKAFAHFQVAVAPSQALADEFRRLGFPGDRLVTSDYGFAPIPPTARPSRIPGRIRIGFAGTLVWHKGADVLVEAARQLPRDRIDVRIFGDETVFPDYARSLRARAHGLPITFMGRYAHQDISKVLSSLDVLVVPSRWLENSPLVIHEAFMARVPIVASDIGGMTELLDGGRHGVLVRPDDPGALAAALGRLLDRPELLDDLAARSPSVTSIADDASEWETRYREAIREVGAMAGAS